MRKTRKKKKNKEIFILLIFLLLVTGILVKVVYEEPSIERIFTGTHEDFYEELAPLARDIGKKYDLFPSVILAQAALESGYGKSQLTREYNNYFGIKATTSSSVRLPTTEVEQGKTVHIDGDFETYPSVKASFKGYGKLVGTVSRYEKVRQANSPEEAAQALYDCGYSTSPKYPKMVMRIIEKDELRKYDE